MTVSLRSIGSSTTHLGRRKLRLPIIAAVQNPARASVDTKQILKNVKPKLVVGGEFVDAASGKTLPVIDPRTGDTVIEVAEAGVEDVDRAVAAARKAFDEGPWPRMSPVERGRLIYKFADLLEQNFDELALLGTLDNGMPLSISRTDDVSGSISHLRYFAGWADKIEGRTLRMADDYFGYTLHEPVGVVGQLISWNFPLLVLAWTVAPALACGCTMVLKCAEQTPLSALRAAELALEAGIPPGVFNVIPGDGPTAGAALVTHPLVDKVSLTGSTRVGRKVMGLAAENLTGIALDLTGKSPFIVCEDVDVDEVAAIAHDALFYNQGQSCCAATRTFVHEKVYDEFLEKSVEMAKNRTVGDPFTDVDQGPQIDENSFSQILKYIDIGKNEGATLLCGGNKAADTGYYIQPTVFGDVSDEMVIVQEEIFGPVQTIMKFSSVDEVLQRANANPYGLASGIFTKNMDTASQLSRGLRAGTVWVNCYNNFDDVAPFGGYKASGFGRQKGEDVLKEYTEIKTVISPLNKPTWS